jgi:predicted nucleotidyltransferase
MFPTSMFDTPTQRKILRVLSEKNRMYTSSELADMCHRSESSISRSLENIDRYDFIRRDNISGSKKQTYGLDSGSRYSSAIREFFEIERSRERKDTVPLEVWNFLEDVVHTVDKKSDHVIEIFLFGSYATGNYYKGSDVDLLVLGKGEGVELVREEAKKHRFERETQVLGKFMGKKETRNLSDEELIGEVRDSSPVGSKDTMIPLLGEIEL